MQKLECKSFEKKVQRFWTFLIRLFLEEVKTEVQTTKKSKANQLNSIFPKPSEPLQLIVIINRFTQFCFFVCDLRLPKN